MDSTSILSPPTSCASAARSVVAVMTYNFLASADAVKMKAQASNRTNNFNLHNKPFIHDLLIKTGALRGHPSRTAVADAVRSHSSVLHNRYAGTGREVAQTHSASR